MKLTATLLVVVTIAAGVAGEDPTTTTPNKSTTPLACPDGWFTDLHACYYYSGAAVEGNFNAVALECRIANRDATPVTIHSTDVNDLLGDNIDGDAWIGLSRAGDAWGWSDGSEVDFTAWGDGEPVDGQDCAAISFNGTAASWSSARCGIALKSFLCEIRV